MTYPPFMTMSSSIANTNNIPMLNANNLKDWKETMLIYLGCMDLDLALRIPRSDDLTDASNDADEVYLEKWDRSNRMSLMIIKCGIPEAFRGATTDDVTDASEFLQ
ncbi:hypothetical protein QQ045_024203 [Rhodiola kirilowii]